MRCCRSSSSPSRSCTTRLLLWSREGRKWRQPRGRVLEIFRDLHLLGSRSAGSSYLTALCPVTPSPRRRLDMPLVLRARLLHPPMRAGLGIVLRCSCLQASRASPVASRATTPSTARRRPQDVELLHQQDVDHLSQLEVASLLLLLDVVV